MFDILEWLLSWLWSFYMLYALQAAVSIIILLKPSTNLCQIFCFVYLDLFFNIMPCIVQWKPAYDVFIHSTAVECGPPSLSSHLSFTGNTFYPSVIQFSCALSYAPIGPTSATCQSNRQWSAGPPTCNCKLHLCCICTFLSRVRDTW